MPLFVLLSGSAAAQMTVPFVGCETFGQSDAVEAPKGTDKRIKASAAAAARLAYYQGAAEPGVLAPRGWHCLGDWGSSGQGLSVAPESIDPKGPIRQRPGFGIEMKLSKGDSSGRYEVAEVIARVFPAHRSFMKSVLKLFDWPQSTFPLGPYPNDKLTYRNSRMVEFTTPAGQEGLGTHWGFTKGANPIDGVAILTGGSVPDVLLVSIRLPEGQRELAGTIIRQFEAEAKER